MQDALLFLCTGPGSNVHSRKNAERSAQVGISKYSFLSKLYFIAQHRCVALLYGIPLGIFNCVIN